MMRKQTTGSTKAASVAALHSSANQSGPGGSITPRRRMPTTPLSRPAKRSAGASTRQTTSKPAGGPVASSKAFDPASNRGSAGPAMSTTNVMPETTAVVVRELRPKHVLAATLLVQGRQGKDVAKALNVAEETISRWRHRPEFQALMRELLHETIDATRLGIVSLCAESIDHLRGLVRSFNDDTSLKAIALVLGKVGPVLGVIGEQVRSGPE